MKNIDRVTEAFMGGMGESLMHSTRTRLHWLCSHAKGENVLDVGCSQGISSLILAREGKRVTGIDICKENINYAKDALASEDKSTQNLVEFLCIDFITYARESGKKFDSIIMGEVLEHLSDPDRFVKFASEMLVEDGIIVVTVPFGINDYHDHKRTYYLVELFQTLERHFSVQDVCYLGKWMGIHGLLPNKKSIPLDANLFLRTEKAFYSLERNLVNSINELTKQCTEYKENWNDANNKYRKVTGNNTTLKGDLEAICAKYETCRAELEFTNDKYESCKDDLEYNNAKHSEEISAICRKHEIESEEFIAQISTMTKQLDNVMLEQSEALANHSAERTELLEKITLSTTELGEAIKMLKTSNADVQRLRTQLSIVQKENSQLRWQLGRITNTWYGKLGMRTYRLVQRIKRRIFK